MRIVFMGTPEFAVPSLTALLDAGYEVVAAITQPDRPVGRSKKLQPPPVKALAEARGIPVLQFERIRRQEGLDALRALAPDLCVTAAFGQILSQKILDVPRLGTINVHASLLPKYRGPAPINWCIIEGETTAGVTTMMTDAGIDTGDMLLQEETIIGLEETAGELTVRLAQLGANVLLETLRRLAAGTLCRVPQDETQATRQPMLDKETGRIDWTQSATRIANLVRGVSPWPGAWTMLPDGGTLKIWKASATIGYDTPGKILWADRKRGMAVACGEGVLEIHDLQASGSKRMACHDYFCGHTITPGDVLGQEDA